MAKIGQTVVYNTTKEERAAIEDESQKKVPAMITNVNDDEGKTVNLQIFWDKEATPAWRKEVKKGMEEGCYCPI